jgi:hypothetical protein
MENLPQPILQYIDTFLGSYDKPTYKLLSKSICDAVSTQPWAPYRTHFISQSHYEACFKRIPNEMGTILHGHQLQFYLLHPIKNTVLNTSFHCAGCYHSLPANSLIFPTLFSCYHEDELVVDDEHDCSYIQNKIRRATPVHNRFEEDKPTIFTMEYYRFNYTAYVWQKLIFFACSLDCLMHVEARIKQTSHPFIIASYCIEDVRRITPQRGTVLLDLRLIVSESIGFKVEVLYNNVFSYFQVDWIYKPPHVGIQDTIDLKFSACLVSSGKETHYRHQTLTLVKEFALWRSLLQRDFLSTKLRKIPSLLTHLSMCQPGEDQPYIPDPPSVETLIYATHALNVRPIRTLYTAEHVEDDAEIFTYTFSVKYVYDFNTLKWNLNAVVNEGGMVLSEAFWYMLCTTVRFILGVTQCFQYSLNNNLNSNILLETRNSDKLWHTHLTFNPDYVEEDLHTQESLYEISDSDDHMSIDELVSDDDE